MRKPLPSLIGDRRGVTAIVTGLAMIVVLGFVGFGIDFSAGYTARRAAQNAADSSAYTGAVAHWVGAGDFADQAKAIAAGYGFTDGSGGVSVAVNNGPLSGAFAGNANAVEVIVTRPAPQFFGGLFASARGTISARAVATVNPGQNGSGCVVTFDPNDPQTFLMNGNPDVNLNGCAVYDNSASSQAFAMNGSASIAASSINVVGGVFRNGNTSITGPIHTGVGAMSDPYANLPTPAPSYNSNCDSTSVVNAQQSKTFHAVDQTTPYFLCGGLIANGQASIHFDPGIYVIQGSSLIVNGGANITGTGVTLVLAPDQGGNVATVTINGNADIDLSAPPNGPTAGLVFYQDRRASHSGSNILNGGATEKFNGALYFPSQPVTFNGNNGANSSACTELLAWSVTINGDAQMSEAGCNGTGMRVAGVTTVLVE